MRKLTYSKEQMAYNEAFGLQQITRPTIRQSDCTEATYGLIWGNTDLWWWWWWWWWEEEEEEEEACKAQIPNQASLMTWGRNGEERQQNIQIYTQLEERTRKSRGTKRHSYPPPPPPLSKPPWYVLGFSFVRHLDTKYIVFSPPPHPTPRPLPGAFLSSFT